jgi:hypothetical protein
LYSGKIGNELKFDKQILQEKAEEATKQKEEKRKKPKPEEHEGMPQRQHCPYYAKRRGDKNHSTMKSCTKTLHEFKSHIPPKTPKRKLKLKLKLFTTCTVCAGFSPKPGCVACCL